VGGQLEQYWHFGISKGAGVGAAAPYGCSVFDDGVVVVLRLLDGWGGEVELPDIRRPGRLVGFAAGERPPEPFDVGATLVGAFAAGGFVREVEPAGGVNLEIQRRQDGELLGEGELLTFLESVVEGMGPRVVDEEVDPAFGQGDRAVVVFAK